MNANTAAIKFWNWFKENNKAYLFLDSFDESVKEELLEEFLTRLHQYCDKLYFEIGGFPDEEKELIITAEGNKKYFSTVEMLLNAAPKIDGWKYIPLKQPITGHFKSKWDNLELDTEDMWFLPLEGDGSKDRGGFAPYN
jgi:hypothetical protein